VLRAIYLTRRFDKIDLPEVSHPLTELGRLVETNERSGARAQARRLVGRA
jgi:hypothetical protein